MAETALITPINPLFLNLIRGVGLVLGLAGAAVTIANRGMPWAKKLVVIVVLPLLCAYVGGWVAWRIADRVEFRSEEHTSELQSLMRISYAVFCLKKKTIRRRHTQYTSPEDVEIVC